MPSQEAAILADFLLAPASLRDFITLKQFTDIFPSSHRSSPAVKQLYQELQRLRQEDVEAVRLSIVDEVKRSRKLKRECARERQQDDRIAVAGLDPIALQMEQEFSGHARHQNPHTLQSIYPSIEDACKSIEEQIEGMEDDIRDALVQVQDVVGELSDLRYGSFPKPVSVGDIREDVVAILKRLEAACVEPAG